MNIDEDEEFFPIHYDLEQVFDEQLQPHVKAILNICLEYNIPMVAAFQYKNSEKEAAFCTSTVIPLNRASAKLKLAAKQLTN